MDQKKRIELFRMATALLQGHFILTSGLHAANYVAKRRLYTQPMIVSQLCEEIAAHFKDQNIGAVVSPAVGGVALCQWVAYHLTLDCLGHTKVLAVFAEKIGEGKEFGFSEGCGEFLANKRVLIVDDVRTTGGSLAAVINAVQIAGGKTVGVSVLWDRNPEAGEINNIPFFPLIQKKFPIYNPGPEECPLCAKNVPFTKVKR